MTKSQQIPDSPQKPANQNNQISNDPADGRRLTDKPEAIAPTPAEKAPVHDAQDEATVEEFGREGMGIAAKE